VKAISPTVGVVIVSYETAVPIRVCLESLLAEGGPHIAQVVVVDNASTDGSVGMIAQDFPTVEVLALSRNVGFAAACNRGAALLDVDYTLFLNPDTKVLSGAVDALLDAARRNPNAGQIGGRTIDGAGHLDPSSCWGTPSLWGSVLFATGLSAVFPNHHLTNPDGMGGWKRDDERDVGVVTGCWLLMPTKVFGEVGGFDEIYFLYGEDVDLSMRVRRSGWRTIITPDSTITHLVGAASSSSIERSTLVLKGRMTLYRRMFGPLKGRIMRVLYLVGIVIRAVLPARVDGSGSERKAPWRGLLRNRSEWWSGYSEGVDCYE